MYANAARGEISASILFPVIIAFDNVRMTLVVFPVSLSSFSQAKVSMGRIAVFLSLKEQNQIGYTRDADALGEVIIESASLYWNDPTKPLQRSTDEASRLDDPKGSSVPLLRGVEENEIVYPKAILSDINIHAGTGELLGIVGPVGSGKSTLCSAVLNECILGEGSRITLKGKVAYA